MVWRRREEWAVVYLMSRLARASETNDLCRRMYLGLRRLPALLLGRPNIGNRQRLRLPVGGAGQVPPLVLAARRGVTGDEGLRWAVPRRYKRWIQLPPLRYQALIPNTAG